MLIMIIETLISLAGSMNDWIGVTMMWCLTSPDVRSTVSRPPKRPLLCLLLAPAWLSYWNPFSIILPTASFAEPLFQHVLMNVEDVVSLVTLIKTVQSPKLTNQLRFRRLNPSLTISSSVKTLKYDTSAAVITMIP